MIPTKEGWMTNHPTSEKRVEVVNAEYVRYLEQQIHAMRGVISNALIAHRSEQESCGGLYTNGKELEKFANIVDGLVLYYIEREDGEDIRVERCDQIGSDSPVLHASDVVRLRFLNYRPWQWELLGNEKAISCPLYTVTFASNGVKAHGLRVISQNEDGTYNCSFDYWYRLQAQERSKCV